jgi:hypothetical protein
MPRHLQVNLIEGPHGWSAWVLELTHARGRRRVIWQKDLTLNGGKRHENADDCLAEAAFLLSRWVKIRSTDPTEGGSDPP